MYSAVKRLLVGHPLRSEQFGDQRLSKRVALAVFGTENGAQEGWPGILGL